MMGPDDEVWLMIGDPEAGCYDAVLIEIDFGGLGAAGNDSTIALCGTAGTVIDLHDLISEGANPLGDFEEETFSGQFNEATGELNVAGLGGTYVFTYTVEGIAPCPDDEATFTVEVYPQPIADFEYVVDGVSSADGLGSTCIINTVDFVDFSTIPAGGTITSWDWDFGGDGTSTAENPSHVFTTIGTFVITLTVTTDDGCTSTFTKEIIIYTEPILDVIFNEPTCFGFSDGSITAFVAGGSGTFDIEIVDEDDNVLNAPGSNTANTLGAGTYTITVMDGSGCFATATVILVDPLPLDAFYTVVPPLCYGDTGYITIDSVVGEAINNAVAYFWAPLTDVENGFNADSVNVPAGDYVLTINDSKGCSNVITITMTQPPELTGTVGYEPAYCRLYDYQSGSGVVFAAGAGGTGDPSTPHWRYLEGDPPYDEADQGTWGGRNPGDYEVTITDDNGCVFIDTVTVDSLNPIADFTVTSDQLNEDCKGTATVDVVFTNTSLYFANPNNPLADTTFFWNLDTVNVSDYIVHDYEYAPDSSYIAKGQSYEVEVCLIAFNKNGCQDEKCKTLTIFEPIAFDGVNIFSPDGDGINDDFTFEFKSASISELECVIVNRWGIKVGEITEPNGSWDGTDMNGSPCRDGVYFYVYSATADNGVSLEGQGSLQIINSKKK
jgi:gliding motility-associated-like protein